MRSLKARRRRFFGSQEDAPKQTDARRVRQMRSLKARRRRFFGSQEDAPKQTDG